MKYAVEIEGRSFQVQVESPPGQATVDGRQCSVDLRSVDGRWLYSLIVDNCPYEALVEEKEEGYAVTIQGEPFQVMVKSPRAARLALMVRPPDVPSTELSIKAPLPGLIVAVEAKPGQAVKKGQILVVLQAMKMDNDLIAPRDSKVREVLVSKGDTVEKGHILLILE